MTGDSEAPVPAASEVERSWFTIGWGAVRRRWLLVVGVTLVAAAIAVGYLRSADYLYTATLRLAPAPSAPQQHSGFGALSGLASLAGATGDASEPATPFRLFMEGVYAPEVADSLARHPEVMHVIFAREWDATQRRWRPRPGLLTGVKNALFGALGAPVPPWQPPDGNRLREFIVDHVLVAQSVKSPLATMSFDAVDPAFAAHFLTLLDKADDDYLRSKTLARSRADVAYLAAKLATVTLAEHRVVLSVHLSDEERQLMDASNPLPYAADAFGRVTVSPQPTRPKPIPVLIGFVLAGAILGIAAAVALARGRAD